MALIDPANVAQIKSKVTTDLSVLGKLFRAKNSNFQIRSVDHSLVDDLKKDGWEEYGQPLKTKARLRKIKTHDVKFEDDIWCQLYKLGYRILNYDRDFVLPYGKGQSSKKQIDIIAVNDENILLIECKSSKKIKNAPSFKTEFEGLKMRLNGFTKTLALIFGHGRRVKYIFATRNLRIDRDGVDIQRLNKTGSFHYSDNTFDYVDGLIRAYRDAAHYQFQALLFRGTSINNEKIEVPAVEGRMGKKTYYMFSIEPHLILKLGFILHRTRANDSELPTYQRLLVPSRLKGIGNFIEDGGYFPNSIILNFGNKKNKLVFESSARKKSTRSRYGTLKIPNAYAIAYIIDGQHRVYGYANSSYKKSNTIPVVAFIGLEPKEQLDLFMQINENQKAVSPTLRITLQEDLYWDSERTDYRIKALRSSIIRKLGTELSSPLYGKISIGEDKSDLSAKPFDTVLAKSGLLPQARGNKYVEGTTDTCLYGIGNLNHHQEMVRCQKRIVRLMSKSYQCMEEELSEEIYEVFITSNRGTYAFNNLLGSLNTFVSGLNSYTYSTDIEKRFLQIEKYLRALAKKVRNLSSSERETISGKLGAGADTIWFRFFQEKVNEVFPEYEPADLIDWKERQDRELQNEGGNYIRKVERYLKTHVISTLQMLYDDNWDLEIGDIKTKCEARATSEMQKKYKDGLGRQEIQWTEMFTISDYKTIISKNWTKNPDPPNPKFSSFQEVFAINIDLGFNSIAEKTKWLSLFNDLRNKWAHEGTKEKGLNKDEIQMLKRLHGHFFS